jgi:N-acyl-D-aspartate/D-glutamate deacylase
VQSPDNRKYEGRRVGDIAAEEGRAPIDVMFDIALADRLETIFSPDQGGYDRTAYELRGRLWADDRTLVGASDAGAHLDLIDSFAFSTVLLEKGVREFKVISLEEAVHQITLRPATYFGFIDRGAIRQGYHADLVVFDPSTVARGPTSRRTDLPGSSAFRLYADAVGIRNVFVNGTEIVRDGGHSGKLPGKVLRSGSDTRTMPLNALRAAGGN